MSAGMDGMIGLPKQDEGARLVAKRVVHAAVRLLNALLDDRQIVRPVHRLERPRVRLVLQERPVSASCSTK